jgi:hypothetical protein
MTHELPQTRLDITEESIMGILKSIPGPGYEAKAIATHENDHSQADVIESVTAKDWRPRPSRHEERLSRLTYQVMRIDGDLSVEVLALRLTHPPTLNRAGSPFS